MRREVQIMHHLKGHDNIVTLVGAFEDKANVHLASLPVHHALPHSLHSNRI